MVTIIKMKKGDTLPTLAATLQYANGTAIDLTGATACWFQMGNYNNFTAFFSGAAVITGSATGNVEYRWTGSSDTSASGLFWGEFKTVWTGSVMTLPSNHDLKIDIYENYG